MGEVHAADGVAVRLRADQPRPADFPARASLAGHDDGLIENALGEFFEELVADVAAAARVERGHQGDRLCRILGCLRGNGQEAEARREERNKLFMSTSNRCSGGKLQGVVRDSALQEGFHGLHGRGDDAGRFAFVGGDLRNVQPMSGEVADGKADFQNRAPSQGTARLPRRRNPPVP